jgi:hypothetical protein
MTEFVHKVRKTGSTKPPLRVLGNTNRDTTHQWPAPRPRSGGGLRAGVVPRALPLAGCQLQDQPRRMRRDGLDHITQIHERIDLQVLAGLDQRTQDGGSMRRRLSPREQPIFAAQHDRSERLLRSVVVDPEPSVFGVAR